jgi:hypothetical protein
MPRFFQETPQAGRPLSMKGLAAGWAAMARALEGMKIRDGSIDWRNGIPEIIPGETSPESGAVTETCYVLRKATAADVASNGDLVEGQWLISKRTFAAGTEESYEATVPHTCPVVTT